MRVDFLGFDWSDYLLDPVVETVDKAGGLSAIAEAKVDIKLSDERGVFSSLFAGINYNGEAVTVSDDYGTIFSGEIVGARKNGNTYIVTCQSTLAKYLRSVVSIEIIGTDPATIIKRALVSFGLSDHLSVGSFAMAAARYGTVFCNAFATASQGMTLAGLINSVGELGSLRVFSRQGTIYAEPAELVTDPDRTLTSSDFLDIPQVAYSEQYYTRYSVDFVGSGSIPIPATGGAATGPIWQQSTGAGSPVQCASKSTADRLGAIRIARDARGKQVVTGKVDTRLVPLYADDTYTIILPTLSVSGVFRVQKYQRTDRIATATFEEVLF